MLEAALEYLKHGFSVFPCGVKSSKPHPEWVKLRKQGWADLQNRRASEDEVREWWTRWPNANIAIVTGRISGVIVVDVDAQHGGTSEGLPPTGCRARTGQGGEHRLYRYPPDAINVANQVNSEKSKDPERRGRDVRADGGYIVAAPSVHHITGKRYVWESFEPASLGEAPAWVFSPVEEKSESKEPWLTKLIREGTHPGQRNDDLTRFTGYWASVGVPLDVGLAITEMWMDRQDLHDWDSHELETTVRSVYRTEARRNPERRNKNKPRRDVFKTMTLNQFMRKYGDHEIRWTVEEWLPEATIAILVSPPGGYKTWLTFDLAVSIASGKPFLGRFPVYEPGPVLVVQQEDFNSQTAERHALIMVSRLGLGKPEITDDFLSVPWMPDDRDLPLYYHADRMLRFDDTEVMDAVEEFVKTVKPKLVIIDPLYAATSTDEYMVKAASDMSRLKTMRDVYGTSFLIVHHTKKSAGFERLDAWGSQFINAFMETGWHIRRPEGERFIGVKRHFKLADVQSPVKLTFDIDSEEYRYGVTVEDISKEELERIVSGNAPKNSDGAGPPKGEGKKILEALAVNPDGMTVAELAVELDTTQDKISNALRALLKRGDVREDVMGRWAHTVPDLT